MLFESDFYSIFGSALIVCLVFIVGFKFWDNKSGSKNELEKAITTLKISTIGVGGLSILLWFMLPSTPSLSSFGYPETVMEMQSNEQVLSYLQEYNQAIVRTTKVVSWFIFIFVWWFLASLFNVLKVFSNQQRLVNSNQQREEFSEKVKEKF